MLLSFSGIWSYALYPVEVAKKKPIAEAKTSTTTATQKMKVAYFCLSLNLSSSKISSKLSENPFLNKEGENCSFCGKSADEMCPNEY